ncbi:multisubstrate pseudouridine synthase 7 [Clonorchis sinensis]|uniref:Multisubstrate pseudouridine synthase 7 n=1 Tax=Clonorchis sinensis TaxID=79923 RepID=G7YC59_CLOSI|nr:multisubstrate pseudouridine synthase 7 [Clonorchis sinensis]
MAEPESKRARLSVDAVDCDGRAIEDIELLPNISEQNAILTESDAGIEGYLRPECPGFKCILKNRHLLRGEWTHAIDLILIPTFAGLGNLAISQPACLLRVAWQLGTERLKNDGPMSFLNLPRNLRQLYVHSYQSLIWNRIASRRVNQSHAGHAQPGDLYIQNAADSLPQIDAVDEALCLELNSNTSSNATTPVPSIVTAENYQDIPLTDVVLPLPGFAVSYPQNQCGRWYEELMKEDGICQQDLRHRVKDFALPGSYRALVVKPTDVNFRIEEYLDPNVPLVKSDLQRLVEVQNNTDSSNIPEDSSLESTAHPYRALILEFTLPKSSYATIAIRELTKSVVERR